MRKLVGAAVAAATLLISTAAGTGSASALTGGESLGCRIAPGTVFTFNTYCSNSKPTTSQYSVAFQVQNLTGSATYAWQIPTAYQSRIYTGCAAADNTCAVWAARAGIIDVSVTVTQGAASETLSSEADIEPYCGSVYC